MELYFRSRVENRMFCRSFMRFMDSIQDQVFERLDKWLGFYQYLFVLLIVSIETGIVLSFLVERQRRRVMVFSVRQINKSVNIVPTTLT